MSSPHPLNVAVIAQALHDLRTGQLRRCLVLGFTADELEALKHPAEVAALLNATVPWCSVRINHEVLRRLLYRVKNIEKEIETVDRMLRLGASTEMLSELHGLTHQEVALRRQMLGLGERRGRWPTLTEQQDATLWQEWKSAVQAQSIALNDDARMLELSMELADRLQLPLSVIWNAVAGWIDQGLI